MTSHLQTRTANVSLTSLIAITAIASVGAHSFTRMGDAAAANIGAASNAAPHAPQAPQLASTGLGAQSPSESKSPIAEPDAKSIRVDGQEIMCPTGWLGPCTFADGDLALHNRGWKASVARLLSRKNVLNGSILAGAGTGVATAATLGLLGASSIAVPAMVAGAGVWLAGHFGVGWLGRTLRSQANAESDPTRFVHDAAFRIAHLTERGQLERDDRSRPNRLELDGGSVACSADWLHCELDGAPEKKFKHGRFGGWVRRIAGAPMSLLGSLAAVTAGAVATSGVGVLVASALGVTGAAAATGAALLAAGAVTAVGSVALTLFGRNLVRSANQKSEAVRFVEDLNFRAMYLQQHDLFTLAAQ